MMRRASGESASSRLLNKRLTETGGFFSKFSNPSWWASHPLNEAPVRTLWLLEKRHDDADGADYTRAQQRRRSLASSAGPFVYHKIPRLLR
jgi:hypothetical protein